MLELQTQEILIYDPNTGQHVPVPAIGASGGAATVDPTLTIPGAAADAAAAGAALQELSEKVAVGTGSYALIADITIEEDVDSLYIDKDSDGNPYDFKAVSIEMYGGSGSTGSIRIEISNGKAFAGTASFFGDGRYSFIRGIYTGGIVFYDCTHSAPDVEQTSSNGYALKASATTQNATSVHFRGAIKAGSTIKIWGLK